MNIIIVWFCVCSKYGLAITNLPIAIFTFSLIVILSTVYVHIQNCATIILAMMAQCTSTAQVKHEVPGKTTSLFLVE